MAQVPEITFPLEVDLFLPKRAIFSPIFPADFILNLLGWEVLFPLKLYLGQCVHEGAWD